MKRKTESVARARVRALSRPLPWSAGRGAASIALGATLAALFIASPARGAGKRAHPAAADAPKVDQPAPGDFAHTPAPEQTVDTPLPVYVEAVGGVEVGRVVVKYKGAQMNDWRRLDMKRMGVGWGALIPCGAVKAGAMLYWFQGFDAAGEPSGTSGDPRQPYSVPVREVITSEAPHLPRRAAPQACGEDAAQVPPEGAANAVAAAEVHETAPPPTGDLTPPPVEGAEPGYARWWLGVAGAVDFLYLPAADDACTLDASERPAGGSGYYCTNPDGTNFPTRANPAQNATLIQGQAGHADSGVHPGDVRAMLAVDYALSPAILLGVRLGYVLDAYPTAGSAVTDHRAFGAHVHAEARIAYAFGDAPLTHPGFAPTVFFGTGAAPFDGHETSMVAMKSGSNVPIHQPVELWQTNGPWFVTAGGGARYQFSQRAAFTAAARLNVALGGAGALVTYGPEIAFQYGL